jgi:hypothetical protein
MVIELACLYLAIGAGCAAASLWAPPRRGADAAMLLGLWPLLGPLLLARQNPAADRIDPAHGDLAERAAAARRRLADFDRALERPELDLERARARVSELEKSSSDRALAAARRRAESIVGFRARRKRLADELEELAELLAQLQTQSEIFRLSGAAEIGAEPVGELIADIEARLFGVEQLLQEDSPGGAASRGEAEH